MTDTSERTTTGPRLIVTVYVGLVLVAGAFGALVGVILPVKKDVAMAAFGPITFSVTPLNMAVYGMINVGLALGVLMLAVRYVSHRYDDEEPVAE